MNQRSAWDDDEQTTTTEVPSAYAQRPPDADATSPHRAQSGYDPPVVYGRAGYDDPFASQRSPRPGAVGAGVVMPESLRDGALAAGDVYADPFVSQRSPAASASPGAGMSEEQRRYEADLRRYEAEKAAYEQQQREYEAAQAAYEAQQAAAAQAEYQQKLREYEEQKRAYEQQQRDYEAQQRAYEAQQRAMQASPSVPRRSLPPGASTMASVERPPSVIPRPVTVAPRASVPAPAPTPAPSAARASMPAPAPTPAPSAARASIPAPAPPAARGSMPAPAPSAGARAAATLLGGIAPAAPSTGAQPENAMLFKMAGASQPPPRPSTQVSADGTGMIDLFALQRAYGSAPAAPQESPFAAAAPPQQAPVAAKKSPLPLLLGGAIAALLVVAGGGGAITLTLLRAPAGSVHLARLHANPAIFLPTRTSFVPEPVAEEAPKTKAAGGGAVTTHAAFTPPRPTVPRKPDKCAYCKGKLDCVIKCQSSR
jgi:hypothetical protein